MNRTLTRRRPATAPFRAWPPAAQARLLHAVLHCDADTKLGTGARVCDTRLDVHGQCPRADRHV